MSIRQFITGIGSHNYGWQAGEPGKLVEWFSPCSEAWEGVGNSRSIWRPQFEQSEFALLHGLSCWGPWCPCTCQGPRSHSVPQLRCWALLGAPHRHPLKRRPASWFSVLVAQSGWRLKSAGTVVHDWRAHMCPAGCLPDLPVLQYVEVSHCNRGFVHFSLQLCSSLSHVLMLCC